MAVIIHGLVSGLIWAAILGSGVLAIAAVIVATAPADQACRARPQERSATSTDRRSRRRQARSRVAIIAEMRSALKQPIAN